MSNDSDLRHRFVVTSEDVTDALSNPDDQFVVSMLTLNHRERKFNFSRSIENRIARFADYVDRSHEAKVTERSRMPLWFRDARWMLTPAKSTEWLRMMLARIKKWVRGE